MADSTILQPSSVSEPADAVDNTAPSSPDGNSATPTTQSSSGLTDQAFVEEIREDRLRTLWKATLVAVFLMVWVVLLLSGTANVNVLDIAIPLVFIGIASMGTRALLNRGYYYPATWVYALGLIATVSVMHAISVNEGTSFVPFLGVLSIFVIGMLMSIQDLFLLLFIHYGAMLGLPLLIQDRLLLNQDSLFAMFLMGLSALLVAQVSGELYGIAQWALENYRKERQTANALHESRLAIEKSLLRQKNLTLQLQEVNEELNEARKSAEVAKHFRGIFLANMSHELRTPLNAIIGFSDTMLNFPVMYEDVELPPEYRADLEQINTSGNHLLRIINDILDLSKIDAGRLDIEIERVELEPIFKSVLDQAVGLIGGKPVELHRDLPDRIPDVMGDPLRIRQVIINLYSNAAKFTQEGHIILSLAEEDDQVVISVEDTGPGIDPETHDTIFEAFRQGKSGKKQQRQGAGLGLAISKELLDLMEGEIWFESEVDVGTTFYVALPKYKPEAEATAAQPVETGTS